MKPLQIRPTILLIGAGAAVIGVAGFRDAKSSALRASPDPQVKVQEDERAINLAAAEKGDSRTKATSTLQGFRERITKAKAEKDKEKRMALLAEAVQSLDPSLIKEALAEVEAMNDERFQTQLRGMLGHRQQWPLALLGMADGAQAAWIGGGAFDAEAAGLHTLGSGALGTWLAELGMADQQIPGGVGSATFTDSHIAWSNEADPAAIPAWREVAEKLAGLEESLPSVGGLFEEECRLAAAMGRFAADRAVARREGAAWETQHAFKARLAPLCADYRRLWLARSRYGGLQDSYQKLKSLAG